jgi:hypothetical protein
LCPPDPFLRGNIGESGDLPFRPRDLPVLAVLAVKVTPYTSEGIRKGTGQKVEERFLLDRVDRFRTDLSVGGCIQGSPPIFPDAADTVFPFLYDASMVAEGAMDGLIFTPRILERFMHGPHLVDVIRIT